MNPRKKPGRRRTRQFSRRPRIRTDSRRAEAADRKERCSTGGRPSSRRSDDVRSIVRATRYRRDCQDRRPECASARSKESAAGWKLGRRQRRLPEESGRPREWRRQTKVCRKNQRAFGWRLHQYSTRAVFYKGSGGARSDEWRFELADGVIFAEALQAIAKTALQRRRSIRIRRNQIPERLAAVFAEIRQSRAIGIGMARNIFAYGTIRMAAQALQSLGVGARVFADQAKQIEVFFRGLLDQFFQHFRLGVGAQHQPNLFVPRSIDLIKFAGARVNQFLERAALLLGPR